MKLAKTLEQLIIHNLDEIIENCSDLYWLIKGNDGCYYSQEEYTGTIFLAETKEELIQHFNENDLISITQTIKECGIV